MIALIVVSILVGIAMSMSREKAEEMYKFIHSAEDVLQNFIKLIMYYAPMGLGCYFASLVGSIGSTIALGFLKTFIVFTITSILFMFIFYTLYAFIAGRKMGVKLFWKNILPVALTAVGTCSSAASVPINISYTKKIGVPHDIAETTVSLGTSFHKDGSCMGSVFKIMFLVNLFGTSLLTIGDFTKVLGIALLATLLVTAVPIGGGTISEMLILSMLNYNVAALPILTIIATIIDAPATLLNVIGDTASSMLVTKKVEKNNWLEKSQN